MGDVKEGAHAPNEKEQAPTAGEWQFTEFCRHDGQPLRSVQDIQDTLAFSAGRSDRIALFGVSLNDADEDGRSTVVCYTGNGPNAHNNARLIACTKALLAIAQRWAALDAGSWHAVRYAAEKRELLDDTRAAIAKATGSP